MAWPEQWALSCAGIYFFGIFVSNAGRDGYAEAAAKAFALTIVVGVILWIVLRVIDLVRGGPKKRRAARQSS